MATEPGAPRPLILLSPPDGASISRRPSSSRGCRDGFSLLCGRYEGVDQRVSDHLVDGELSVGDFVLAGGELAALVVVEAVTRLRARRARQRGVGGRRESFTAGLLEYPQFTRPATFRGWEVPEVLRSGDHGRIERWRRARALARTLERRPDLIAARGGLTEEEVGLLADQGKCACYAITAAIVSFVGAGATGPAPTARPGPACVAWARSGRAVAADGGELDRSVERRAP